MPLTPEKKSELIAAVRRRFPGWSSFSDPRFQAEEVDYKRRLAERAKELLSAPDLRRLVAEKRSDEILERLEKVAKYRNNLLFQGAPRSGDLGILYKDLDKERFASEVVDLIHGEGASEERLGRYAAYVTSAGLTNKWTLPTFFLFVCHPESEILVKPRVFRAFLELLGKPFDLPAQPAAEAYANVKALADDVRTALTEFGPRDMIDIQSVIWVAGRGGAPGPRFWKVSPGERASNWEACRDGGYIAVGWDEFGALSGIHSAEFERRWETLSKEHPDWRRAGVEQLWTFAHIQPGDRIVANQGKSVVLGIGTVTGTYYFGDGTYGHRLPVRWDDLQPRSVKQYGWQRTVLELDRKTFDEILNEAEVGTTGGVVPQQHSDPETIPRAIQAILNRYSSARSSEPFAGHELADTFRSLQTALAHSLPVQTRPTISVKASMGQGNWAKVPWVSLLDSRETNTTQKGVYAVLLFRQDMTGVYLTLNQGVTEPKGRLEPSEARRYLKSNAVRLREQLRPLFQPRFRLDDEVSLRADPGLGSDYESSTIAYQFYDADRLPSGKEILEDLESLLQAYDHYLGVKRTALPPTPARPDLGAITEDFAAALRESHVSFGKRHDAVVRDFVASLATKRFVILTGLSGSGKTQIALQFGRWLGKALYDLVPVRPDWTGAEAVFGYEDALQPLVDGRRSWYVPRPLQFMLRAAVNDKHPYLLLLDEMNLAHVERYLADLLSGMESGTPSLPNLQKEDDGYWRPKPDSAIFIAVPSNLFLVGTVNVDETTYSFSPKVLDRANTIEFRVETDELLAEADAVKECREGPDDLVRGFLQVAQDSTWQRRNPAPGVSDFVDNMQRLHELLSEGGFEFGHRVFFEAIRFASMLSGAGNPSATDALDYQVLQKVLPRLHGSRRRLEPTLCALGQFCMDPTFREDPIAGRDGQRLFDPEKVDAQTAQLPRSFAKVKRMTSNIRANQFTSFTE